MPIDISAIEKDVRESNFRSIQARTILISVWSNKGGPGKSTTVIESAVELARRGIPSLIVDCDTQCDASSRLLTEESVTKAQESYSAAELKGLQRDDLADLGEDLIYQEAEDHASSAAAQSWMAASRALQDSEPAFFTVFQLFKKISDHYDQIVNPTNLMQLIKKIKIHTITFGGQVSPQAPIYLLKGSEHFGDLELEANLSETGRTIGAGASMKIPAAWANVLRLLALALGVKVIFRDLNPASSHLNKMLIESDDVVITPYETKQSSKRHVRNMRRIFVNWHRDIEALGFRSPEQNSLSSFPLIPPQLIGAIAQKVKCNNLRTNIVSKATQNARTKIILELNRLIDAANIAPFVLCSVDPATSMDAYNFQYLVNLYNEYPVLIKHGATVYLYGHKESSWQLTELDARLFESLVFPAANGPITLIPYGKITEDMWQDLIVKQAHDVFEADRHAHPHLSCMVHEGHRIAIAAGFLGIPLCYLQDKDCARLVYQTSDIKTKETREYGVRVSSQYQAGLTAIFAGLSEPQKRLIQYKTRFPMQHDLPAQRELPMARAAVVREPRALDRRQLFRTADGQTFKLVDVAGDGNCAISALNIGLASIGLPEVTRQQVIEVVLNLYAEQPQYVTQILSNEIEGWFHDAAEAAKASKASELDAFIPTTLRRYITNRDSWLDLSETMHDISHTWEQTLQGKIPHTLIEKLIRTETFQKLVTSGLYDDIRARLVAQDQEAFEESVRTWEGIQQDMYQKFVQMQTLVHSEVANYLQYLMQDRTWIGAGVLQLFAECDRRFNIMIHMRQPASQLLNDQHIYLSMILPEPLSAQPIPVVRLLHSGGSHFGFLQPTPVAPQSNDSARATRHELSAQRRAAANGSDELAAVEAGAESVRPPRSKRGKKQGPAESQRAKKLRRLSSIFEPARETETPATQAADQHHEPVGPRSGR